MIAEEGVGHGNIEYIDIKGVKLIELEKEF
ncbi:hypothetical protein CLTEP_23420 [Clostridium tepidiprofundi DSM 19306]|uniref:Uncharacterized protein n=1 Tax=Clostridium tepidiprofundi DSM 19306 TaxID=1121338 RepID=A0A151AVI0_9CLOT|nr:hypothetical protein CLTEP_23420 [Clostridium tepidiprofundi DSM 19306]